MPTGSKPREVLTEDGAIQGVGHYERTADRPGPSDHDVARRDGYVSPAGRPINMHQIDFGQVRQERANVVDSQVRHRPWRIRRDVVPNVCT
jgi:hypothetical protein